MTSPDSFGVARERLDRDRLDTLSRLGRVSDQLLYRPKPISLEGQLYAWPANAIGSLRIVRTKSTVLVVTNGLSDPWDPSLHHTVPDWRFGFELAVAAPILMLEDATDLGIANSWMPELLWALSDWMIVERVNLKQTLVKFSCMTVAIPPITPVDAHVSDDGYIGGLIGIPYVGDRLGAQVVLAPDPEEPVWLLPLKVLTADEYKWLTSGPDQRTYEMAEAFLWSDDRHLNWPERESILPKLQSKNAPYAPSVFQPHGQSAGISSIE